MILEFFAVISTVTAVFVATITVGSSWVLGSNYFRLSKSQNKELLFTTLFMDFILRAGLVTLFWNFSDLIFPFLIRDYDPDFVIYFRILPTCHFV